MVLYARQFFFFFRDNFLFFFYLGNLFFAGVMFAGVSACFARFLFLPLAAIYPGHSFIRAPNFFFRDNFLFFFRQRASLASGLGRAVAPELPENAYLAYSEKCPGTRGAPRYQ